MLIRLAGAGRRRDRPGDGGRQRGSVLLLMPVAVLVFIVLGAVCVDFGVVFLAERELSNAAAAAANDAATRALDVETFFADGGGTVRVDPVEARRVAGISVASKGLDHLVVSATEVMVAGPTVTVTVTAEVGFIFAKALPGGPTSTTVEASADAEARRS